MRQSQLRVLTFLFAGLLALSACSSITGSDEVRIRLRNTSTLDFQSTIVNFGRGRLEYGALAAGSTSAYQKADGAYSYAYVEVEASGQRYVLQPIDYVGEKRLKGGDYTYELSLIAGGAGLSLTQRLVRD